MSRYSRYLLLPVLAATILWAGCDTTSTDDTGGIVVLAGQVLNTATNNPVPNARVTINPGSRLYEADASGRYSIQVEIDSTMDLQVTAAANGFSSTHGVIGGSVQTSASGQGSVALTSANPLPADGIALVTATTADKDQNDVVGYAPVIFSGLPVITLTPNSLALGQTYFLTVTDYNGNPLVEGTSITVKVEGTAVKGVGTLQTTLDDSAFLGGYGYEHVVRGPGITEFTFAAVADVDPDATNPEEPSLEAITITVSGGNGTLEFVLTNATAGKAGVPGVELRTEGSEARTLPDGRLEVSLKEANR